MRARTRAPLALALVLLACTSRGAIPCTTSADCPSGLCAAGTCRTFVADGSVLCLDRDHDSRGLGCAAGPDCDDDDPVQGAVERCDDLDNDCDGAVDEDVEINACGVCDPSCAVDRRGVDEGVPREPFVLGPSDRDVAVDPDGSLVLSGVPPAPLEVAWLAESAGTLARIDTRAVAIDARFRASAALGTPARGLAVSVTGDVFASTLDGRVIRVRASDAGCIDRDGDGTIRTGGLSPVPFAEEECRVFDVPISGQPLAVAIQPVPGPDGELGERLFVGSDFVPGESSAVVFELDPDDGHVLGSFTTVALPESGAPQLTANDIEIDARGQLWLVTAYGTVFGAPGATLVRADLGRCPGSPECATPCDGAAGDGCALQRIFLPGLGTECAALDGSQRLWLADVDAGLLYHYDATQPFGGRIRVLTAPREREIHGFTADRGGRLWASIDRRLEVFDLGALLPDPIAEIGASSLQVVTTLVDGLGRGWGLSQHGAATIAAFERGEVGVVSGLSELGELTAWCSDGAGARLASERGPHGLYVARIDACPGGRPEAGVRWRWLEVATDVPADAFIGARLRTGSADTIDRAPWIMVTNEPHIDLMALFARTRTEVGPLLDVELVLRGGRPPPRVRSLDVARSVDCMPIE